MTSTYHLNFFVDYGEGPLFPANEKALEKFESPIDPTELPISKELIDDLELFREEFGQKFGDTIDSIEEFPDWDIRAKKLIARLEEELGSEYKVINKTVKGC